MNKKRKGGVLAAVLAAVLCAGALTGCYGLSKPTAKELMEGARRPSEPGYVDMSVKMEGAFMSNGLTSHVTMYANIETSSDVSHLYGCDVWAGSPGASVEIKAEAWSDKEASYMNVTAFDSSTGWLKSGPDDTSINLINSGIMGDDDTEYTLQEHNEGEDLVVTYTISSEEFFEAMYGMTGESLSEDVAGDIDMSAHFDEETCEFKSLTAACESEDMSLNMELKVMSREERTFTIPDEIKNSAAQYEDVSPDYEFGDIPQDGLGALEGLDDDSDSGFSEVLGH